MTLLNAMFPKTRASVVVEAMFLKHNMSFLDQHAHAKPILKVLAMIQYAKNDRYPKHAQENLKTFQRLRKFCKSMMHVYYFKMSELEFESDAFGDHVNTAQVEDEPEDIGPNMTDDEITKLCTTDFTTQTIDKLADAKRQFLQKVKSEVLEYISNVNTSMSQSRSRIKAEPVKIAVTEEEELNHSFGSIGGESPVPGGAADSGPGDTPNLDNDMSDQRGGQVSAADSPRPTGDDSLEFSGSLEYDPFD